jgi:diguanylate cyclase (GGDEF)-like protein
MQPVSEIGQLLATKLRQFGGIHSLILATHAQAQDLLHYDTISIKGHREDWPPALVAEHPFASVLRCGAPEEVAAGRLTESAWLALPLCYAGSALGVLAVAPADQARRQRATLTACANLVATAIYTLQQLDTLETTITDQASTIAGISEIARQLNATLDVQQIVDLLLVHALGTTTTTAGAVLLLTDQETFQLRAQRGVAPATVTRFQRHPLSVAQLADLDLEREYLIVDAKLLPSALRLHQEPAQQVITPLRREGRLLGVLLITIAAGQTVSMTQTRFLEQLTAHAALALSNADAYTEIAQQHNLLDRRLAQLQAVSHISQAISAHLNPQALMPEIVAAVQTTLGYRSALLSLVDEGEPRMVRRVAAIGIPDEVWESLRDRVVPLARFEPFMTDRFRISRSFYIPHNHAHLGEINDAHVRFGYRADLGERAETEWNTEDVLLVPLYGHQGSLVGILSVDDPADRQRPTPETITVLEIFAIQAATAIENARLYANMEHQALTDNLTGLANQRHFTMHLAQHMSWAERHSQGLAVLALDIDHFKLYNDSYGHLVGNVLLREFARVVQQQLRTGDLVARWGGEEFCALLPQSTLDGAIDVAERIRQAVRSYPFPHRSISVSVGVAVFVPGMHDHDFLQAADAALYRAKERRDAVST